MWGTKESDGISQQLYIPHSNTVSVATGSWRDLDARSKSPGQQLSGGVPGPAYKQTGVPTISPGGRYQNREYCQWPGVCAGELPGLKFDLPEDHRGSHSAYVSGFSDTQNLHTGGGIGV